MKQSVKPSHQSLYVDTHCHLLSDYFSPTQIKQLITQAQISGVKYLIIPGTTIENSNSIVNIQKSFQNVYPAWGIHPSETTAEFTPEFLTKIPAKNLIAIGEIGLDFYHQSNPPKAVQIKTFKALLDFALEHDLPALIHMRNSETEIYEILSQPKYQNLKFLIHCFTSTLSWAKKFIALGGYISFSGIITFKNAISLQEIIKQLPLDRILTETDTPYLTPVPFRGKSNQPAYVKHVADFIASLRPEPHQTVLDQLVKNAVHLFKL